MEGSALRERHLWWALLAVALVLGGWTTVDAYRLIGQPYAGFSVMRNLLVGLGVERGGLEPFDYLRAMDGQLLHSARQIQAEVRRHPSGTTFHYLVNRRGRLVEADIRTKEEPARDFDRFLLEGLLPDLLFLTAWAFSPALYLHLAQTFPERRAWALRHPRVIWLAYALSAALAVLLQTPIRGHAPSELLVIPITSAVYWVAALLVLIAALTITSLRGTSALGRQRARVLLAGFAVGQLAPVLGTALEAVTGMTVPYLSLLWKLNLIFPLAVAYAMVRYELFDMRAVVRLGSIYVVVTGVVIAAYVAAITLLNVVFTRLGMGTSPLATAVVLGLAV